MLIDMCDVGMQRFTSIGGRGLICRHIRGVSLQQICFLLFSTDQMSYLSDKLDPLPNLHIARIQAHADTY